MVSLFRRQSHNNNNTRSVLRLLKRSPKHSPATQENMDLMQFLQEDCPGDVLPKILAYCGPQKVAALAKTCTQWRNVCMDDATWRVLCEELYKWSDGDELPTTSWKEFYQYNPCVPVDYSSIQSALAVAETNAFQTRSIRILLRPGDFVVKEEIVIQATEGVTVTIETMKGYFYSNHSIAQEERSITPPPTLAAPSNTTSTTSSPTRRLVRRATSLRNRFNCRLSSQDDVEIWDEPSHPLVERLTSKRPTLDCASIIMHTRKHNEPLFRVKQGNIIVKNLEILHNSAGMDIWNGNSAIQIQPPSRQQQQVIMEEVVRPCMWMESIEVVSHSGRGIVNIDGGYSDIRNCYVHDCAATGIYVGGEGTQALLERTDVLQNGNGTKNRRGVGRGHSGVYLEQGKAIIRDCNISRNSLTGISAVSRHNTSLEMQGSDLVANGAAQLEMPRGAPFQESFDLERNNRLAAIGLLRSRSSLVQQDVPPPAAVEQETAL